MDITRAEFAEYVKNMREAAGISKAELARMFGIHVNMITRYERKMSMPKDVYAFVEMLKEIVRERIRQNRMEEAG